MKKRILKRKRNKRIPYKVPKRYKSIPYGPSTNTTINWDRFTFYTKTKKLRKSKYDDVFMQFYRISAGEHFIIVADSKKEIYSVNVACKKEFKSDVRTLIGEIDGRAALWIERLRK